MPNIDRGLDSAFLRQWAELQSRVRTLEAGQNAVGATYRASDGARLVLGRQSDGTIGVRLYDSASVLAFEAVTT